MIDQYRGPDRGLLVLDGGDALLANLRPAGPLAALDQRRAGAMLQGLGSIGTDGMGLGEAELLLPTEELLRLSKQHGVPLLAANLEDRRGRRPFLPRRLISTGGIQVGIFALFEEPPGSGAAAARGLRVLDPAAAARVEVAALLKEGAELIVMIAHLGMPRAREVATAVPGIHLGLVAHTGWRSNEPEVAGQTFLMEPGRRGQALAHLEVRLAEGWQPGASLVDDSRRHVLYQEASRELDRVRKSLPAATTAQIWQTRILPQAERARLLAKQLAGATAPAGAAHSLIGRLIELDETVPEHPGLKALLQALQAEAPTAAPFPGPRVRGLPRRGPR